MSRYRLEIRPSVEKTLRKIRDQQLQQRLDTAFEKLCENRYRFRVGDHRIVNEIHDSVLLVLILAVGDRKEIYR